MSIETEAIVSRNKAVPSDISKSRKKTSVPLSRLKRQREGVETPERLRRWPGLKQRFNGGMVSIYSGEHDAFWREGGYGLTNGHEKWVLPLDEALTITSICCPKMQIEFHSAVVAN